MKLAQQRNPYLATDTIIEYENRGKQGIVLIERKNFPLGLALPGGFHEWGLSAAENAQKEGKEETGLELKITNPERPLCVHSNPLRDPRGHVVSITFIAQGYGVLRARSDAKEASLYTIAEVHELLGKSQFAFYDHERAVQQYLVEKGLAYPSCEHQECCVPYRV